MSNLLLGLIVFLQRKHPTLLSKLKSCQIIFFVRFFSLIFINKSFSIITSFLFINTSTNKCSFIFLILFLFEHILHFGTQIVYKSLLLKFNGKETLLQCGCPPQLNTELSIIWLPTFLQYGQKADCAYDDALPAHKINEEK